MPRESMDIVFNEAKAKVGDFLTKVNAFMKDRWQPFEQMVKTSSLTPFKPYAPVSLD